MIINTTQVEMVLNNKAIPAYSLEAETGVSRDRISKLRRGDIKFENMSLKTIMKIQKWIDDGNYRFSYDYTELIKELKEDIAKGLTNDYIYINEPNLDGKTQGMYYKGESVKYDRVRIDVNGFVWISWVSASTGIRRWMPTGETKNGKRSGSAWGTFR